MGQQQLLLLALSSVIVSLAVAAGIEVLNQEQRQATRDALVQRAASIGTDILAAHQKPAHLGGIRLGYNPRYSGNYVNDSQVASAIGAESNGRAGSGIPAPAAGEDATCDIDVMRRTPGDVFIDCGSRSERGNPAGLIVKAQFDPNAEEKVKVVKIGEDVSTAKEDQPD